MPLVTDYSAVKEIYHEAAARGVSLPSFCVEDRETLEAILAGALETGKELGVADLPVVPAWTCRYPGRGQMELLTACGDAVLGTNLMLSDLEAFMGDTSPYRKLRTRHQQYDESVHAQRRSSIGVPLNIALEQLQQFAEQVIPAFKGAKVAAPALAE